MTEYKCGSADTCQFGKMCKPNYDISACSHYKAEEPQTNEEWFCQLPTEEKAKFLFEHGVICCQFCKGDCIEIDYKTKECKYNVSPTYSYTGIIKWLKEKHHDN